MQKKNQRRKSEINIIKSVYIHVCVWVVGISSVSGEDFGHWSVKILVFSSPSGYKLWSFGISSIFEVYSIASTKMIIEFPEVLNFNRFCLKTQPMHLKLTVGDFQPVEGYRHQFGVCCFSLGVCSACWEVYTWRRHWASNPLGQEDNEDEYLVGNCWI